MSCESAQSGDYCFSVRVLHRAQLTVTQSSNNLHSSEFSLTAQ